MTKQPSSVVQFVMSIKDVVNSRLQLNKLRGLIVSSLSFFFVKKHNDSKKVLNNNIGWIGLIQKWFYQLGLSIQQLFSFWVSTDCPCECHCSQQTGYQTTNQTINSSCDLFKQCIENDPTCCTVSCGDVDDNGATTTTIPPQTQSVVVTTLEPNFKKIINRSSGAYVINVYKEGGPCKIFSIAKASIDSQPIINHSLKIDKEGETINLKWDSNWIELCVSGENTTGEYTVSWL